ncbi:MAG: DUF751 family protein [Prochlorococcus sp.]|nr:DUF751 family protein [Prochlorococcus sp.]MDP6193395.1 DUF751 family protein [Prochlorococcaceae cyanobacterium ETNP18_MAG_1]
MKELFLNLSRYPRYLIAFVLGLVNAYFEPLSKRRSNPITAIAMISAVISGVISLALVTHAMVTPPTVN